MMQRAKWSAAQTVPCDGEMIYDQEKLASRDGVGLLPSHVPEFDCDSSGPGRPGPIHPQSARR